MANREEPTVNIDGRRTKLTDDIIQKKIAVLIQQHTRIKKVIFVSKKDKVIEILRRSR